LRIPDAADGTKGTLGLETYQEEIRNVYGLYDLYLSRRPIVSVTTVVEDGATLVENTTFQTNSASGQIERLDSDDLITWAAEKVVVTYQAGYTLPSETDSYTLPEPIHEAAIYAVQARLNDYQTGLIRDKVRSESIEDVAEFEYQVDSNVATGVAGNRSLPRRAVALLAPYRNIMI